jgi:AraC-like DNA-binding protein
VLFGENRLKIWDVLHLVPFLFFTINYFPFYMMDLNDKALYVFNITQNFELSYRGQDGIFPEWLNILVRSISSVFYLALQWHLIVSFFKKHPNQSSRQFTRVKKWVFHLTTIQTIYSVALLLLYIYNALLVLDSIPSFGSYVYIVSFLVNVSFLLVACYLLWNPHVLVGLPKLHLKLPQTENALPSNRIHAVIQEQKTFLSPELTLHSLSKAIGVPSRRISNSIGDSKFSNFNDYINHLRIAYAVDKINDGYLTKYSVDALSETSGFNSKNAFYRAFKKAHGCTPLNYKNAS